MQENFETQFHIIFRYIYRITDTTRTRDFFPIFLYHVMVEGEDGADFNDGLLALYSIRIGLALLERFSGLLD